MSDTIQSPTDSVNPSPHTPRALMSTYGAELIGSFILIFAITATATAGVLGNAVAGVPYGSLALPLVNGIVLAALIGALGHVSGAHFNPAVTIALASIGKFPWRRAPGYLIAQFVGGALGAAATWGIGGSAARGDGVLLGVTQPAAGATNAQAFLVEVLITFILVFVVVAVSTDGRAAAPMAPLVIGSALAVAVFIGGPITGAAVNPIRALGPEFVALSFNGWWIFLLAPVIGGLLGAFAYDRFVRKGTTD